VSSGRLDVLRGVERAELMVEVDGGADAGQTLVATLTERGVAAAVDGRTIVVALEGDVVFDLVRDAIADLGLPVRRLERRTASLEDVFLAGAGAGEPA